MKIIVPMAGIGSRLRPHTLTIPKPLTLIAGKPIVQRLVEDIVKVVDQQVDEIAFVIGPTFPKNTSQKLMKIAENLGAKGKVFVQDVALGTAHAIYCAKESLNGPCVVAFADTLFKADFELDTEADGAIWVKQVDEPSAYGVIKIKDGIITDFVEKPTEFVSDLATYTTWQVFTIDIDADWVGIHKVIGEPNVKCPLGITEVTSGQSKSVVFEVRDESGTNPSFGLNLICSDGFGSLQQSRVDNIGTSYQSIDGYVTISTTTEKDFSCTFEAYDLNNPNNKDSCITNFKGKPFTGCTPGEKVCSSDSKELGTCNSAGTNFNFIDCGQFGCEAFENTYRCRLQSKEICDDTIDNDGDGLIDMEDPDCDEELGWWGKIKKTINDFLEKAKIVLVTIIGLIGGLVGALMIGKLFKNSKNKLIIMGIVGIIFALAIGILSFYFFWTSLIIIILLILIRAFIPGI